MYVEKSRPIFNQKKLLQAYLDNTNSLVIALSEDHIIQEFNKRAESIFGWKSEHVKGEDFLFLCNSNLIESPLEKSINYLNKNNLLGKCQTTIISNKKKTTISWNITVVEDFDDRAKIILLIGEDITRYIEDKNVLDTIIHNVPHTIFWKDINSVVLGCNETYAKSVGFNSPQDVVGKTDYDFPCSKEESDAYVADDREVMRSRKPKLNIEESLTLPDGKQITLLTSKVPLFDESRNVIGVLGIFSDITDLKLAAAREKAAIAEAAIDRAKAEAEEELRNTILDFAGSMAHDQRSPITTVSQVAKNYERILPILLNSYEIAKENLSAEMLLKKRDYEYIKSNYGINSLMHVSEEMNAFIDNSLHNLKIVQKAQQSEISSGDFVTCEIYKCLYQIPNNYAIHDNESQLVHVNSNYKFSFKGNYVLANHIFSNLLVNALYQIRKNGKGEIFISAEDGGTVNLVRFRDTAGGAPAKVVENMFKGYYTTKNDGTGVGLAFCERMMKFFGGSITANSVEGDFMEFLLTFPKINVDET